MSEVKTTVQISFGKGAGVGGSGYLSAEVDSRDGGLNGGKTSFTPGDTVYILAYKSDNVSITDVVASGGSIFGHGAVNVEVTDVLTFANEKEATLSKPAGGALAVTWYGASLGGLTVGDDQVTVTASNSGVAVAIVTYKTVARAYRLSTPLKLGGQSNYEILVVVIGDDGNNG